MAIQDGKLDHARILLRAGADPDQVSMMDEVAIHEAVRESNVEALKLLIEHEADLEVPDEYGFMPLHWAVYRKMWEGVDILVSNGAKLDARAKLTKEGLRKYPSWQGITPSKLIRIKAEIEENNQLVERWHEILRRYEHHPWQYDELPKKVVIEEVESDDEEEFFECAEDDEYVDSPQKSQAGKISAPTFLSTSKKGFGQSKKELHANQNEKYLASEMAAASSPPPYRC